MLFGCSVPSFQKLPARPLAPWVACRVVPVLCFQQYGFVFCMGDHGSRYIVFSPSFPENSSTESSFSLKHFALSKRTIGSKAKQTLQWTHGVVSENCPFWSGCLFRWLFLMGPFYFVFLSLLSMSYIVSLLSLLSISHIYVYNIYNIKHTPM